MKLAIIRVIGQLAPALLVLAFSLRIRQTLAGFRAAGANAADHARTLDELKVRRTPPVKLLVRHGVLVSVQGGRYYLDEDAYRRWRDRRRTVLKIVLSMLGALALWFVVHSWMTDR